MGNTTPLSSSINSPSKMARSYTHKLICPDEYPPPNGPSSKSRHIENSATWRPAPIYERQYESDHSINFKDPKTQLPPKALAKPRSLHDIEAEVKLKEDARLSMERLVLFTQERYGTSAAMMKRFKKKKEDHISLTELDQYLKRDKVDDQISPEERNMAFANVDERHNGSVSVSDYLKVAEMEEFKDSEYKREMARVRHFLAHHAQKKMEESSKNLDRVAETHRKKKQEKAIEGEGKLIRQALGQNTFDIELSHEDTEDLIEDVFRNLPKTSSEEEFRYARFLRHSHLNLRTIPFYDMRCEALDHMKATAVRVDKQLEDGAMHEKFKTVAEKRWRGTTSMPQSYDHLMPDTYQDFNRSQTLAALGLKPSSSPDKSSARSNSGTMAVSQSLPNLSLPGSARSSQFGGGGADDSTAASTSQNSPTRAAKPKPRNLLKDTEGPSIEAGIVTLGDQLDEEKNPEAHPNRDLIETKEKKKADLLSQHRPSIEDFYATAIDGTAPIGRMKDSTKIMRIEKVDSNTQPHGAAGKKLFHHGSTDWGRIGIGGDNETMSKAARGSGNTDRFKTTNSTFYPELIYEPSKPVRRELVSDAEVNAIKRDQIRKARRARMDANMSVTQSRLEYDKLNNEIQQLGKIQTKMARVIRYETATLLNDLKCYKAQPLQRMAKKQIPHLYDKNLGGCLPKQTVVKVPESRDFSTTNRASYNMMNSTINPSDYSLK